MGEKDVNIDQYVIDVVGELEAQRAFRTTAAAAIKSNADVKLSVQDEERAIRKLAAALKRAEAQRRSSVAGTAVHNKALRATTLATKKANGRTIEMRNGVFEFGNAMAISGGQTGLMVNQISELSARIFFSPSALGAAIAAVTGAFIAFNIVMDLFGTTSKNAEKRVDSLRESINKMNGIIAEAQRQADSASEKVEFFGLKAHEIAVLRTKDTVEAQRIGQKQNKQVVATAQAQLLADIERLDVAVKFLAIQKRLFALGNRTVKQNDIFAAQADVDARTDRIVILNKELDALKLFAAQQQHVLDARERELRAAIKFEQILKNIATNPAPKVNLHDVAVKQMEGLLAQLRKASPPVDVPAFTETIEPPSEGELGRRRAIIVKDAVDEIMEITNKHREERALRDDAWNARQTDLEQAFWDQRISQATAAVNQITQAFINGIEQRLEANRTFNREIETEEANLTATRKRLQVDASNSALMQEVKNSKTRLRLLREAKASQQSMFVQIADQMLGQLGRQLLGRGIFDLSKGVSLLIQNPLNPQGELLAAWGAGEIASGAAMIGGSLLIPNGDGGSPVAPPGQGSATPANSDTDENDGPNITINIQGSLSNEETMRHVRDGIQNIKELGL